ncbi:hypothetical protein [Paenirhodobacter populi]|uniref:hypothetical protein n=1 Tax=Paenirhodobacter populi TaxID=2306993 RepID=UPI0013E386EE|nr:hypothetical protein [Sinirhodobacter populi]
MTSILTGSIRLEDDFAVIRIPMSEVHAFRVALSPCPCKAAKSFATAGIRERIEQGLAQLEAHL